MAKDMKTAGSSEQAQNLKTAITQIEKKFGAGSIMKLDEKTSLNVPGISTGSLSIDMAMGGRGFPRGRVVEVYGHESSGKTTITLHAIAEAQKEGGVAAFIDVEQALDPSWARRVGVDLESLLVSQPQSAEDALQIAEMLIKSNAVDIIVLDSVAALVPTAEADGEIGETKVGAQARLMSSVLRRLNPEISKTKTCMVFINQVRQKIGVLYGSPDTTSGGLALRFFSSVRMEVRKGAPIKVKDDVIGSTIKVKIVKNKIAPPFQMAEVDLLYETGFDKIKDLFETAVNFEVLTRVGNYYDFREERIALGKDKCVEALKDNPEMVKEIAQALRDKRAERLKPPVPDAEVEDTPEPPAAEDQETEEKPAEKKEKEPAKKKAGR